VIAGPVDITIHNGTVTCINATCPQAPTADVYTVTGGFVTPGAVSLAGSIGQFSVELEAATHDGFFPDSSSDLLAMDGIFFQQWHNRHMEALWKGGVTSIDTSRRIECNWRTWSCLQHLRNRCRRCPHQVTNISSHSHWK